MGWDGNVLDVHCGMLLAELKKFKLFPKMLQSPPPRQSPRPDRIYSPPPLPIHLRPANPSPFRIRQYPGVAESWNSVFFCSRSKNVPIIPRILAFFLIEICTITNLIILFLSWFPRTEKVTTQSIFGKSCKIKIS